MENTYHVVLLEDPEQRVFSIRKTIGVDQYHALFEAVSYTHLTLPTNSRV